LKFLFSIVIGAAFGTVMKSLVDDILMPVVSSFAGLPDFSNAFIPLNDVAKVDSLEAFRAAGGVALAWGNFVNAFLAFLLVALALFLVIKGVNKVKKAAAAETPANEVLLAEIRDLLKK